jgi:hypothetical protein
MRQAYILIALMTIFISCKKKDASPVEDVQDNNGLNNPSVQLRKHSLVVIKNGNGSGVVRSLPAGLECGLVCRIDSIIEGTTIALVASPEEGYVISGWSGHDNITNSDGNACEVKITQSRTVTATFTKKTNADTLLNWKFAAGCAIYYSSPAVDQSGNIYFGTGAHFAVGGVRALYSLDPLGQLRWKYETGLNMYSPCVGADGTIYIQDALCKLYAVNTVGSLKWSYQLSSSEVGQTSPAIGNDGTIYAGADALYAINADGTLKWKFDGGLGAAIIRSSPAIGADNTIYIAVNASPGAWLWAVNANGTLKWKTQLEGEFVFSSPAIGADGTIYISTENQSSGFVNAISASGLVVWKYLTENIIRSSPVISNDGTIYVATKATNSDAKLLALSLSGSLKWMYSLGQTGSDVYCTPSIGLNGDVIFGAETQNIYFVKSDGSLRLKYNTNNGICWSSPAVLPDGSVVIGNNNGDLYSIKSSCLGLAGSPWPKFRANNRNTGIK